MILLLLISAVWVLILALVVAICLTARVGDLAHAESSSAPALSGRDESLASVRADALEIAARANRRTVRSHEARPADAGASLAQSGGVAA
jgi:hypothetical protein